MARHVDRAKIESRASMSTLMLMGAIRPQHPTRSRSPPQRRTPRLGWFAPVRSGAAPRGAPDPERGPVASDRAAPGSEGCRAAKASAVACRSTRPGPRSRAGRCSAPGLRLRPGRGRGAARLATTRARPGRTAGPAPRGRRGGTARTVVPRRGSTPWDAKSGDLPLRVVRQFPVPGRRSWSGRSAGRRRRRQCAAGFGSISGELSRAASSVCSGR